MKKITSPALSSALSALHPVLSYLIAPLYSRSPFWHGFSHASLLSPPTDCPCPPVVVWALCLLHAFYRPDKQLLFFGVSCQGFCHLVPVCQLNQVTAGWFHVRSYKDRQSKEHLENVTVILQTNRSLLNRWLSWRLSWHQPFAVWRRPTDLVSPCPCCSHLTTLSKCRVSHKSPISFQNNMLGMEAGEVNYSFASFNRPQIMFCFVLFF